ncbi:MAG: pseudouridine synthase, partial [Pseudomonadota bacterium]|nr:pseudouridine synthase [Pseudomonadota bacterium]
MSVRHVVIEEHAGQRLDNFLHRELKNVPRSRIYRMVRRGEVRINGGRIGVSYRLQRGDRLRIPPVRIDSRNESHIGEATINQISRAIMYEDEELLVLNKPVGVAVHGGSGIRHGIIEILRQTRSDVTFELVHRLDRDTSGCMLIAKTRRMLLELHAAFREARVKKRYDAVVTGDWPQGLRTVRHSLRRYTLQSGERRVRIDLHGDKARTDFEIQQRGARVTRL